MPYIKRSDLQLYYEREGRGPSLILLAGYTCDLSIWDLVRKELSNHFDLILIDNRGAGKTGCPSAEFTVADMAQDVSALIETLSLSSPHILGHSMGGMIAQELSRLSPHLLGKVILAQTACSINPVTKAVLQADLHGREQGLSIRLSAELMMPWLFSPGFLGVPPFCEAFLNSVEKAPPSLSLEGQAKQSRALLSFNSLSWCSSIKIPCLVCVGEKDLLIPPTDSLPLLQSITGSVLHTFPDMGHMAPIEVPAAFCAMISTFLAAP